MRITQSSYSRAETHVRSREVNAQRVVQCSEAPRRRRARLTAEEKNVRMEAVLQGRKSRLPHDSETMS